jgi:hypothetical protein
LEENAASFSNKKISHVAEVAVRHIDRSKEHDSVNEVFGDSGTRRGQGQNNQGGGWEEESVKEEKR